MSRAPRGSRTPFKGVTRYQYKRARGWLARVTYRRRKRSKLFSDGVWGGAAAALDAAIAWRDRTECVLGRPRSDRVVQGCVRGASGIQGVQIRDHYALAHWSPEPNVIKRAVVMFSQHGVARALRRAVAIRQREHAQALLSGGRRAARFY